MRLAFMGTPDFSVPVLEALMAAGHQIVRVYTQPPRPAGRGKALRPSAVHKAAEEAGLEVQTPERFRDETVLANFQALDLDAAIVVAYGQVLPKEALDAPRLGCLNIHASLLPRWRGAAPIQRAIMAGDEKTGVAIMQMDVGLDTGDVLAEQRIPIGPDDTAATLHDRLSELGAGLLVATLPSLEGGQIVPQPQPEDGVTYAKKIDKAEAKIDWTRSAAEVDCHVRGLSPFPGAWFDLDGTRIKVLMSEVASGDGPAGTVLDDALTIATGTGAIRLLRLQKAGRGPVSAAEFLRGTTLPKGVALR